jgi:hypothetical protein
VWECNCASKGYHAERGSQVNQYILNADKTGGLPPVFVFPRRYFSLLLLRPQNRPAFRVDVWPVLIIFLSLSGVSFTAGRFIFAIWHV